MADGLWSGFLILGSIGSSDGCLLTSPFLHTAGRAAVAAGECGGGRRWQEGHEEEVAVVARQHVKEQKKDGLALANGVHDQ